MSNYKDIKELLVGKGLKVTTQRLIIYDVIAKTKSHPTAEDIFNEVIKNYPSISLSTVYNTLELFVLNKLIDTVKTDAGIVRYDAFRESHHHLYGEGTNNIVDYYSSELDELLKEFFEKNKIDNFVIDEIKLHIKGKFLTKED